MGYEPDDEFDGLDVIEPLEEQTPALPLRATPRATSRLGLSIPGAIGGVLLIGAMALGANLGLTGDTGAGSGDDEAAPTFVAYDASDEALEIEPTDGEASRPSEGGDDATDAPDTTDGTTAGGVPDGEDGHQATAEPTDKPAATAQPTDKPAATAQPTDKPTPEPTAKPTAKPTERPVMSLSLAIKEGAVFLDWGDYEVDGGHYYKAVRSTDKTVTWPPADNDEVVAVTEVGGTTKAWDEHAPAATTAWYRVFCVRSTEDGYKVLSASATKSIETPDEPAPTKEPAPEPSALWIEAAVDGGAVVVTWEACSSESFSHYRILRKQDGSEASLLAEVEDASATTFVDSGVEVGVTYLYLVQAKGNLEGDWILLGSTEWAAVTIE